MTNFLAAAYRAYIAEPVLVTLDAAKPKEKVQRFLVMFPDNSGKVYLLEKVPTFLQNEARRNKHFREQEIMPAVLISILPNGLIWVDNQTDNPMLGDDVSLFLSDANNGLGLVWLRTWGYITDEMIVASQATKYHVAKAGQLQPHVSVSRAKGEFDQIMATMCLETTKALGLPSMQRAAALKPAAPIAAPTDPVDDDKTQNLSPKQTKGDLIEIALAKGVRATKKWSIDRLIKAIALADQAETDQAVATATADPDAADLTVDTIATVA